MVDRKITGLEVAGSSPVTITFLLNNSKPLGLFKVIISFNKISANIINYTFFYKGIIIKFSNYGDQSVQLTIELSAVSEILTNKIGLGCVKLAKCIEQQLEMAKVAGLSVQELYKLISSHSSMPACLEVIRLSFLHADIPSLHAQVLLLQEVLVSRNQLPLSKYHALLVVNQLLQTARHPGLLFLETYLSSILADICQCLLRRRSNEELESYFTERGYREYVAVRKLSHKFVHKAGALVLLAAAIKPYQNVLQTEMPTPSRFETLAITLRNSGVAIEQELSSKQVNMLRVTFLRQIKGLNVQAFGGFIAKKLKEDIIFKQTISNSTKKLLEIEDAIFSIPAINVCVTMLSAIPLHFQQQRLYLTLFNSFIRQGHVYAIIVVHNASFVSQIFKEIAKVQGQQGLTAGRFIYPEAEASLEDKLSFYCEFLKCLQTWAICLPENEIGQESEVAKLYSFLREDRMFVFPELLLLRKVQGEFHECLQEREMHNEQILRIIQNDDKKMAQYARVKSSVVQLSVKMEIFTQQHEIQQSQGSKSQKSSGSSGKRNNSNESDNENSFEVLTKFKSLLKQANSRIQALIYESRVAENMHVLKSFQKQWSNLKQNYRRELNSQLILQGNALKQKINDVYPLYIRLKKKAFSFNTFRNKIANVFGFRLQDFGLQNFDDYAMVVPQKNPQNAEEVFKKTDTVLSKQSSSVTLGCQSKLKQEQTPREPLKYNPVQRDNSENQGLKPCQQKVDKQGSSQTNEYGIKQLLIKRRQYLNSSKQSIRSKKSQLITQSLKKILPQSILHQASSNQSQKSRQNIKFQEIDSSQGQKNCLDTSKRVNFSSPSGSSAQQLQENAGNLKQNDAINNNRMNVYEVYQILVDGKQPPRQKISTSPLQISQQKTNASSNLRSRLYLQKIRYSSTRRAIQDYSRKVHSSNSSNQSSRTTSKSIINRQYKRIALQQYRQHQSLSKRQHNDYSESLINSSLYSNQSRQQVFASKAIINIQKYTTLFPNNKITKMTKNYIKSKGVLFTNEDIEVGFVHFRKNNGLSFILYLTSSKNLIVQSFQIASSSKLSIHSDHNSLKQLKKNKQQVIKIDLSILDTPFSLPTFLIKFKTHGGQPKVIQFTIPCTFNKFISTKAIIDNSQYDESKANETILQTPKFVISKPQSLMRKISDFFNLPLVTRHQNKGMILLCESSFQSRTFTFQLFCEEKSSGKLIGCTQSQHKDQLQFLLSTFGHALSLF